MKNLATIYYLINRDSKKIHFASTLGLISNKQYSSIELHRDIKKKKIETVILEKDVPLHELKDKLKQYKENTTNEQYKLVHNEIVDKKEYLIVNDDLLEKPIVLCENLNSVLRFLEISLLTNINTDKSYKGYRVYDFAFYKKKYNRKFEFRIHVHNTDCSYYFIGSEHLSKFFKAPPTAYSNRNIYKGFNIERVRPSDKLVYYAIKN